MRSARFPACRVHTPVNASLCSDESEHGTHECVRRWLTGCLIWRHKTPRPTKASSRFRSRYCSTMFAASTMSARFSAPRMPPAAKSCILCGITGRPPKPGIAKTALGSEETVPWEHHADAASVIHGLRKRNYEIAAVETSVHAVDLFDWQPHFPVCILFGHEVDGLARGCWSCATPTCAFRCWAANIRSMSPPRAAW